MRSRWLVGLILAGILGARPAGADDGDKIVRTRSATGLPVVGAACQLLGCQVLGSLDTLPGDPTPQSSLFLVRGLLDNTVTLVLSLLGLVTIEPDLPVAIVPEADWGSQQASSHVVDQ